MSFLWCINKTAYLFLSSDFKMKPFSSKDKKIKTSYKLKQTSKIFEQQSSQQLKHNMPPVLQVLDIKLKTTICIWVTLLSWVPVPRNKQIWAKSPNILHQVWLRLNQWFRSVSLIIVTENFAFTHISLLGSPYIPSFEQIWISSTKG